MYTDLKHITAERDMLLGKLERAKWALQNAQIRLEHARSYIDLPEYGEFLRSGIEEVLKLIQPCIEETPLETNWVPKKWLNHAQEQVARFAKTILSLSEAKQANLALRDEIISLKVEIEKLTTDGMRISHAMALKHKEMEIKGLKNHIAKLKAYLKKDNIQQG